MGKWAAPLGSALSYLVAPGSRQRNDVSAARELNVAHMAQRLPSGLLEVRVFEPLQSVE